MSLYPYYMMIKKKLEELRRQRISTPKNGSKYVDASPVHSDQVMSGTPARVSADEVGPSWHQEC